MLYEAREAGNISGPQSKETLRKLRSEKLSLNLATDVCQETKIIMEISNELIPGGYIQSYSFNPYEVHLITISQLRLFNSSKDETL